jgi:hypothetical protein
VAQDVLVVSVSPPLLPERTLICSPRVALVEYTLKEPGAYLSVDAAALCKRTGQLQAEGTRGGAC